MTIVVAAFYWETNAPSDWNQSTENTDSGVSGHIYWFVWLSDFFWLFKYQCPIPRQTISLGSSVYKESKEWFRISSKYSFLSYTSYFLCLLIIVILQSLDNRLSFQNLENDAKLNVRRCKIHMSYYHINALWNSKIKYNKHFIRYLHIFNL